MSDSGGGRTGLNRDVVLKLLRDPFLSKGVQP